MWSFRAYLKAKCADPKFLDQYREGCNICPKTVLVFSTIREQGLTYEDVARRAGVELEHLELLEEADRASPGRPARHTGSPSAGTSPME